MFFYYFSLCPRAFFWLLFTRIQIKISRSKWYLTETRKFLTSMKMILTEYLKDMLFIFNLLLRPLNSNMRDCIQRMKTNYVIWKKKGAFCLLVGWVFCCRWKMLPSSNESWMTHLLLGKSEVASDLIAFSAVNTSKKESLRDKQ